jgi:glycosyltransferase involved in cell wall biosynthesis
MSERKMARAQARETNGYVVSANARVVFEQYVIPRYRVPFFAELAKRVDLVVVASEDRKVDGVTDVRAGLPFAVTRLPELPGSLHHPGIGRCLRDHHAQVWISYDHQVERFPAGRAINRQVEKDGIRRVHMGCDGYTVRDFAAYRRAYNSPRNEPRSFPWRVKYKRHLRKLDGFVVYSSHSARFIEEVFGIQESRITVAHNAVDTTVIAATRAQLAASGLARDPERIAFVGRMTEGKGVDTLLHAFRAVSQRHPCSSLVLVGDGSAREEWEHLAASLGLNNVEFYGAVFDEQQLASILCRCSVFVLPGLGGLALNTAMAAGLAIVCTHGDGTELDLIEEGVNGWHFRPGNRTALAEILGQALSDPERLARMGNMSAARVEERFSLQAMVDAYVRRIELSIGSAAGPDAR